MKYSGIGGQAVMEGVMMQKCTKTYATTKWVYFQEFLWYNFSLGKCLYFFKYS